MTPAQRLYAKNMVLASKKVRPPDNLITSYADFLKHRDQLYYYDFNPKVVHALMELTDRMWTSSERFSRISLLSHIDLQLRLNKKPAPVSRYYNYYGNQDLLVPLSKESMGLLFKLFKRVLTDQNYLPPSQREQAIVYVNKHLSHTTFNKEEIIWLFENVHRGDRVLNRILRYPAKSPLISAWVRDNFDADTFRSRRAEMISWILDEDPTFEVSKKTIVDDFNYANKVDMDIIDNYKEQLAFNQLIESEFSDILPLKYDWGDEYKERGLEAPDLQFPKRFYNLSNQHFHSREFPDLEKLSETFYKRLDTTVKITMIWAAHYSRLNSVTKGKMFIKFYNEKTSPTIFKIVQRKKMNMTFLKWAAEQ